MLPSLRLVSIVALCAAFSLHAVAQQAGADVQPPESGTGGHVPLPAADAAYKRGVALQHDRRTLEALEQYQEALRIDPGYELAVKNYAGVLFSLELYGEGLPWFERALEIEPRSIAGALGRARAYRAMESEHAALAAYRIALARHPHNGAIREEAREFVKDAFGEEARELASLAAPRPAPRSPEFDPRAAHGVDDPHPARPPQGVHLDPHEHPARGGPQAPAPRVPPGGLPGFSP